jgi:hypothetical protein
MYSTVAVDDISNSVSLNVYGGVITVYNDDDVTFTEQSIDDIEKEINALGTDVITSIDDLSTISEKDKVKLVTFKNSFNYTNFGVSNTSLGLVYNNGTLIQVLSYVNDKLIAGGYNKTSRSWGTSRTVTTLTAYTPS